MSNISESGSVDRSQIKNMRRIIVNKSMKKTFNAAKILSISTKNLCKSTGYLECQDFNVKVNDLINYYESMSSTKPKNPLKNVIVPKKRKSAILEGISNLETNKLSEFKNGSVQISEPVSKKIKKNVEEKLCTENNVDDKDSSFYCYGFGSCAEVGQTNSYEQINYNFSLPNHDSLNHALAEHFVFDNEMVNKRQEKSNLNNPDSSKKAKFTHWEINNKNKTDEDEAFSNREKLFVLHDKKGRVNGYHVKLLLSTSEEDREEDLDEGELKASDALSQHSNLYQQPINFDKSEELNEVAYTNFKYPSLDLAEDLLRCTKCDSAPHYHQVVRRLFDCARLGDFSSLAEKQKVLNEARKKRKAEELENAKKRVKRAASKPVPAPVSVPSPVPKKTYTFKRKRGNKSKQAIKRKNLTKTSSNQEKTNVNMIEPVKEIINDLNKNEFSTKKIEPVPMTDECNVDIKSEVELKKINTSLFDDKRAELISMGLLPSIIDTNLLGEESEVGKFVKTELTSMGLLPSETDCVSLEKVNNDKIRKFKCDKCESTFTSSNGKKYHINKVHTTEKDSIEKPYKCLEDGCYKKFTSKNGLKSHKKIKHPAKNTM